jgi:perosamine synthetase
VQINLGEPSFGSEELDSIERVMRSNWVAGQGPETQLFESEFSDYCGAVGAVALNNCTAALHLSLVGLGIGAGDEVIVADYTYPATGHAVLFTGAKPVFCDVVDISGHIDVSFAETLVTKNTKAIIAVDVAGQPADYKRISEFAKEHGLYVIEDAAPSAGAKFQGIPTGNPQLADVTAFSFHGRKGITCGEGGAVTSGSQRLLETIRSLSCFGVESALNRHTSQSLVVPEFGKLGYNYKLSDISSAIMRIQLSKLDTFVAKRQQIARHYNEHFRDLTQVSLPLQYEDREHSYQAYLLTLNNDIDRDAVVMELRKRGIGSNIGTFASHMQPVYGTQVPLKVSESLFYRQLALPMHTNLTEDQVAYVITNVTEILNSCSEKRKH